MKNFDVANYDELFRTEDVDCHPLQQFFCDEDAPEGDNFPAEVCKAWERAFAEIATNRTRKVVLRLGVVLGPDGGLLGVLGKLTRWFLGGHVGNGRQFISWIHIRDVIRMITRSIDDPAIEGPFNATRADASPSRDKIFVCRPTSAAVSQSPIRA